MLRYLLDTNIVIYVLKRRPLAVLSTFNANASRMAISSITLTVSGILQPEIELNPDGRVLDD